MEENFTIKQLELIVSEYLAYYFDVRNQLMTKPMTFRQWFNAQNDIR